jgi:hypothetical protein
MDNEADPYGERLLRLGHSEREFQNATGSAAKNELRSDERTASALKKIDRLRAPSLELRDCRLVKFVRVKLRGVETLFSITGFCRRN